jgi:hypothetical protein
MIANKGSVQHNVEITAIEKFLYGWETVHAFSGEFGGLVLSIQG